MSGNEYNVSGEEAKRQGKEYLSSENGIQVFRGIDGEKLDEILDGIKNTRVALIGDMCLDIYWRADMTKSELSRETPHFPLPVVEEWMSPGAGGNVAANIAALAPREVYVLGVAGRDWRGDCLLRELRVRNINTSCIVESKKWITQAYCKPLRRGISGLEYEDPRIDFCNFDQLVQEEEKALADLLEQVAPKVDVLCVADQFQYGCITPGIRSTIIQLAKDGLRVVVDSRDRVGQYSHVILKPNELEGCRAVFQEDRPRKTSFREQVAAAGTLAERNHARVCMTLGPNGCVYCEGGKEPIHVPSFEVMPPLDTVGAGDCFLSAFSCALAAGAQAREAAAFANMAADVIIKKIGTTGTASPLEIRERHREILNGRNMDRNIE